MTVKESSKVIALLSDAIEALYEAATIIYGNGYNDDRAKLSKRSSELVNQTNDLRIEIAKQSV